MYASRTTQFIVGIFAILGIIALAILSLSLGKVAILPAPGYTPPMSTTAVGFVPPRP